MSAQEVSGFGVATATTISSGGSLIVSAGGRARDTTNNGGRETVFSAGSGGFDRIDNGGLLTVSAGGGEHDDTIQAFGSVAVLSGGAMAGVTINGSGAVLDLLSGAGLGAGAHVTGGADFNSAAGGQLRIGGSEMPLSVISGFVAGDTFDLTSIAFDSRGSTSVASGNGCRSPRAAKPTTSVSTPGRISPAIFSTSPATGAAAPWSPKTRTSATAAAR